MQRSGSRARTRVKERVGQPANGRQRRAGVPATARRQKARRRKAVVVARGRVEVDRGDAGVDVGDQRAQQSLGSRMRELGSRAGTVRARTRRIQRRRDEVELGQPHLRRGAAGGRRPAPMRHARDLGGLGREIADERLRLDRVEPVLGEVGRIARHEGLARLRTAGRVQQALVGVLRRGFGEALLLHVRVLAECGQAARARRAGGERRLPGEPVGDPDGPDAVARVAQPRHGAGQDRLVGVARRVRQRLVVAAGVEEVRAEAELVPDLDVEVPVSERVASEARDHADVVQPAAQRGLESGVGRAAGELRALERAVAQRRHRLRPGRERLRERARQRRRPRLVDRADQHVRPAVGAQGVEARQPGLYASTGLQTDRARPGRRRFAHLQRSMVGRSWLSVVGVEQDQRPDAGVGACEQQAARPPRIDEPAGILVAQAVPAELHTGPAHAARRERSGRGRRGAGIDVEVDAHRRRDPCGGRRVRPRAPGLQPVRSRAERQAGQLRKIDRRHAGRRVARILGRRRADLAVRLERPRRGSGATADHKRQPDAAVGRRPPGRRQRQRGHRAGARPGLGADGDPPGSAGGAQVRTHGRARRKAHAHTVAAQLGLRAREDLRLPGVAIRRGQKQDAGADDRHDGERGSERPRRTHGETPRHRLTVPRHCAATVTGVIAGPPASALLWPPPTRTHLGPRISAMSSASCGGALP